MNSKKTTTFENGLIWFGAAASLAEIMTGTAIAPLGFSKGILAIIIGHLIGCILLFLTGLIGGQTKKSSMETVKTSFGHKGYLLFVLLNIVQLIGWTAIMIYDGTVAANEIFPMGNTFWAIVIGALIAVWIMVGIRNLGKLNTVAISSLFVLTVLLAFIIFSTEHPNGYAEGSQSFGAAIELSIAMPLSWLVLISDYTKEAQKPFAASMASSVSYFAMSSFMYIIGLGAAIFVNTSDLVRIILKSGIGIAGLFIIVLSTVTTTFMDAFSAGVSSETLSNKINGKWIGIAVTVIGVISTIVYPLTNITDFLYIIGSVFAPMIAIQLTDYFILKNDFSSKSFQWRNLGIWLIGFVCYRILMRFDIIIGNTLPCVVLTAGLCILADKLFPSASKA